MDSPPTIPSLTTSYAHGTSSTSLLSSTVAGALQATVERCPDREAVVFLKGGIRKTFSQLQHDVSGLYTSSVVRSGLHQIGLLWGTRPHIITVRVVIPHWFCHILCGLQGLYINKKVQRRWENPSAWCNIWWCSVCFYCTQFILDEWIKHLQLSEIKMDQLSFPFATFEHQQIQ